MADKVQGPDRNPNRYPVIAEEQQSFRVRLQDPHSSIQDVFDAVTKRDLYYLTARQAFEASPSYKAMDPGSRLAASQSFKRVQCLLNAEIRPEPNAPVLKMNKMGLQTALKKDWKETSRQLGLPNDVAMYCESHFHIDAVREYMQTHIVDMVEQEHLKRFNEATKKQQHCAMVFSCQDLRKTLGEEKCWRYVAEFLNVKQDSVPKKVQTWIMDGIAKRYRNTMNSEDTYQDNDIVDYFYQKEYTPGEIFAFLKEKQQVTLGDVESCLILLGPSKRE